MTHVSAHDRAGALFLQASDMPAGARDDFLRDACADDHELLAAVRRLLEHDGAPWLDEAVLGRSVSSVLAEVEAHAESLPERIGPYDVLARLGAGSMGVVYRARQDQPRRELAVKLLRTTAADDRLVRRIGFEAEVLARLDHPGIAHVYAAGWHHGPDGSLPYLAMELVQGRPLLEWIAHARPSRNARVELLAQVCDAVSHAHGRGVIHRDLKPENILVSADGQPKVLDFGIARMTRDEGSGTTLVTRAGQLVGTLAYMSPEQVGPHPEDLDIRADVYALGVLAYVVLGGRAPYDVHGLPLHDATRVIREAQPTPLGRLDGELRGDLETVVAHALEKQPDRRYASASALAADLRRVLAGEAIHARPESGWRQLQRLARRHPLWTAATALLVLAPLVTTVLERRASRALKLQTAEQRATQAALADLLADTGVGRWPGGETVAELMQRADELVPHYARGDVGLEGSLWTLVGRYLAQTEIAPGQRARARRALERGLELQALAFGNADPRTLSALVDLAELAEQHGDSVRAWQLLEHFERHAHRHFEPQDERLLAARLVAARLQLRDDQLDAARDTLIEVFERARAHLGAGSDLALAAAGLLAGPCDDRGPRNALLAVLDARLASGAQDERTVRGIVSLLTAGAARHAPTIAELELERRAIEAHSETRDADDPTPWLYWNQHAGHLDRAGDTDAATCLLHTSWAALQRSPGARSRQALDTHLRLADLWARDDRHAAAEAAYMQVLADLPAEPFAALDLRARATHGLALLQVADGRAAEALARLHHLDALREQLLAGTARGPDDTTRALAAI